MNSLELMRVGPKYRDQYLVFRVAGGERIANIFNLRRDGFKASVVFIPDSVSVSDAIAVGKLLEQGPMD